ncbi:MAG: hypothetical protein MRJ68_08465 [Nitrospira sp.]|nr:hypothetical protein [Nitrospira sp.]
MSVWELHGLEPVLVQAVIADAEVQKPHEYLPFSSNGTRSGSCCLPPEHVVQAVLGRQRRKRPITKGRQEVIVKDALWAFPVDPLLHGETIPKQGHKVTQGLSIFSSLGCRRRRVDFGDHCDRSFLGLFLGEVVAEQGPVPLTLPADV